MKIELMNLLKDIIYVIMVAVIPVLTTYGVKLINVLRDVMDSYIDKADAENELIELDRLHEYVKRASEMIEDIVITVNQTFVDDLKKSNTFDSEAQLEAFSKAYNTALEMMSDDMKEAVQVLHLDLSKWVGCQIENFVNKNKPLDIIEEEVTEE